jgi:hypothetical protein
MTTTANRRFAFHYLEMVVAMFVGMGVFAPVWHLVFDAFGSDAMDRMSLWMWFRGHTAAPIAEMAAAMYLPFVVLLVPLWLGVISSAFLMVAGHVLMLGTMLLAMLYRRAEYSCHHRTRWSRGRAAETATESGTAG